MSSLAQPDRSDAAPRPPVVFLIAGEESGDRLGANLMRAIRARVDGQVTFAGVGGREMAAQGLRSVFPIDDLAIIGFGIVQALPLILRRIREAAASVIAAQPDVLVIIDSPDFTHRIARRVRKVDPTIPIVNYVSPSVWAWRSGRARAMRGYVDHVLALLPFEPQAHVRLGGPPCDYVGHPSIERLDELRPSAEEAACRQAKPPVVLVLPGSRSGEVRRLAAVFGAAIGDLQARAGPLDIIVPTPPALAAHVAEEVAQWTVRARIVTEPEEKWAAFRSARAALAKSGTVTLELALAGIPMVTAYKGSLLDEAIARLAVRVPSAILTNLVLGENAVPEFLQRDCTAKKLADALEPLLADSPQRQAQTEAFARLDAIMEVGRMLPGDRAAEIVLRYATRMRRRAANADAPA